MTLNRRQFQKCLISAAVSAPAISIASDRPRLITGCSSGDVSHNDAILWTRTDRPSQLWVEINTQPDFGGQSTVYRGGTSSIESDFNVKAWIKDLHPGQTCFYRLKAESLEYPGVFSDELYGQFETAEKDQANQSIRFCWSGDTAGQGWGISTTHGGMKTYASMLSHNPQFLVHSGDQIYADGPIQESVTLDDGSIWKNLMTQGKSKVAEEIQDFRDNYYYNYLDDHLKRFHSRVPIYHQWDDHEVINNWYPGKILDDSRYQVKSASLLAERAKKAMFQCNPLKTNPADPERLYRVVHRGPLLDMFFLDLRSYRGPNSPNRQTEKSGATAFMGETQVNWLKQALLASTARWKIICSDMPISAIVTDWGTDIAENVANGDDGLPLGRELELADLLKDIAKNNISNVHWITADVHYCASNHYHPNRAAYNDFTPFWEHISGPMHAGTFAPGAMDHTFGPEQVFCGVPKTLKANRPPSEPYQFFGKIDIDHISEDMTVSHYNSENRLLWQRRFTAD